MPRPPAVIMQKCTDIRDSAVQFCMNGAWPWRATLEG